MNRIYVKRQYDRFRRVFKILDLRVLKSLNLDSFKVVGFKRVLQIFERVLRILDLRVSKILDLREF